MTSHLSIIGAGYTGLRLAALAVGLGYEVLGTTRSESSRIPLKTVGATALRWDIVEDEGTPPAGLFGPDTAVVYSVPTLFDDPAEQRHVAPVARALEAARDAGCDRFVYLSSTSVYGDHQGEWIDEESERRPTSPVGIMRRDIEDCVLGFEGLPTDVVRIVGIYGPGRTLDRYIARGRYKLVGGGEKLTNRIHVDDLTRIILAVIEKGPVEPRAYIAADGNPRRVVELVDWMVENLGIERPDEVSLAEYRSQRGENAAARWENTYLARNTRVIEELSVHLHYPDVICGYEAIFGC